MNSIIKLIDSDIKQAMKGRDKFSLSTLRMLKSAIRQVEIDGQKNLNDDEVIQIIKKSIKQGQQSAKHYQQANRDDLAQKENDEITLIGKYMPEQIEGQELSQLIQDAIDQTGAESMQHMGKVIALIKAQAGSKVDMADVSSKIKSILS